MHDAIALLKNDHKIVKKLMKEMDKSKNPERRTELLAAITQELKVHTRIEEEIFYPAFKDAVEKTADRKLFFEAEEEHSVVDHLLPKINKTNPGSELFSARAKVLLDLVSHHAQEEETQMFPKARLVMSAAELKELGARMAERKKQLDK